MLQDSIFDGKEENITFTDAVKFSREYTTVDADNVLNENNNIYLKQGIIDDSILEGVNRASKISSFDSQGSNSIQT